jgi:hypothetical protein
MHAPKAELDHAVQRSVISRVTLAVAFVVALTAVSVPILTHLLPPFSDYSNNLASAYVISTIKSDRALQQFYTVKWQIIPNLMMDLLVPVLHRFMNIYLAGQVFTLLAFFLILSGTLTLNYALFRRWSALPLVASVLIYNEVLLVGVMNYVFGIGLALWALAAWVLLREQSWPWRYVVSTAFVLLLFFCHLFALGVYGLGLLTFECERLWSRRREPIGPRLLHFVASGAPFVPALPLLLMSATWNLESNTFWSFGGKFEGLMYAVTVYYFSIAYGIIAIAVAVIAWTAYRRILRFHPVGWFLLGTGAVIYIALPRVLFASFLADQRLPIALAFMLIACASLELHSKRAKQLFGVLLAGVLAVRLAEVQFAWDELEPGLQAFRRSVESVERGSRILVVYGNRDAYQSQTVSDVGLMHAACLGTIERSALVSTMFTVKGKHILGVQKRYRRFVDSIDRVPPSASWLRIASGPKDETDRFYWSQWERHFDYVYVLFTRHGDPNPESELLKLKAEGPGFQLYRVIAQN